MHDVLALNFRINTTLLFTIVKIVHLTFLLHLSLTLWRPLLSHGYRVCRARPG